MRHGGVGSVWVIGREMQRLFVCRNICALTHMVKDTSLVLMQKCVVSNELVRAAVRQVRMKKELN